jgi:uncharacterized protein (DUF1684 family)
LTAARKAICLIIPNQKNAVARISRVSMRRHHALAENPVISSATIKRLVTSIYPNPAGEHIQVNAARGVPAATIVDIMGRTIKRFERVDSEQLLDVMELRPGVYFITFREGRSSQTLRFLKK